MCKKRFLLALTISVFCFSGCVSGGFLDSDMNCYEKIHAYYNKMERYSATVSLTVLSNKTENQYTMQQKAMGHDRFFSHIKHEKNDISVTTITNGKQTQTVTEGTDYSVTLPTHGETNVLFLNSFFKTYYASENTYLKVNGTENESVTVLETELNLTHTSVSKAALFVDNKTLSPLKLVLYDYGEKAIVTAKFSDFIYNDKAVNEEVFTIYERKGRVL